MRSCPSESQNIMLGLIGRSLFGQNYSLPDNTDIPALIRECKQQAITAIALSNLHDNNNKYLEQAVFSTILHNNRINNDHWELHRLLTENGIPYVILKGAASALFYPEPLLRAMGDVDFLVKQEDIERTSALLQKKGFVPLNETHAHHIGFRKDNHLLEMHFTVAGIPDGPAGKLISNYLANAIDTAELVERNYVQFMAPDSFHHGLVMLLHLQHHMLAEGIGVRHLCDWAVFVNSFSDDEFKTIFYERFRAVGLWTFAKAISLTAHIGIGLPYKDFMGNDTALSENLLFDILSSGNFGSKDRNRHTEGMFISNRGKDGIGKNRIIQFAKAINRIIYSQWPTTKKLKILVPIGWLYFGGRRIFRILLGKRKPLHLISSYRGSASRKQIYEKLHLFETEN